MKSEANRKVQIPVSEKQRSMIKKEKCRSQKKKKKIPWVEFTKILNAEGPAQKSLKGWQMVNPLKIVI